jgi:hypothetical protein
MNFIKQLQSDLALERKRVEAYRIGLTSLRSYVFLDKFTQSDRLVNIGDVDLRITEIENAVSDVE